MTFVGLGLILFAVIAGVWLLYYLYLRKWDFLP